MTAGDWPAVEAIYEAGLAAGNATFETTTPTWEQFDAGKLRDHRFVATDGTRILGWVAASPVSTRDVYAGVVEHSVYVDPAHAGRGIGTALLQALIASTETAGIWTVQSSIFPENTASLALHHRAGFRTIGTRERIAQYHGLWRDTILVERRSRT
ncbi:GNAT family N-acetyltransferase [Nakamurella aerolata]|uniref:N-acetyltransferase n=1 Tax=Nakamurella aerolata TaxID=1656892 RepID=A0A849A7Q9_9ACTN|nr:GNAT family N-acetyltransferase [Nakamurella aerolata]NNG35091.1 N-acetyltransferase [Nakamurella aerolata]